MFYKKLADMLFDQKQKDESLKLIVVIPHDDKNVLLDALHKEVKQSLAHVIGKQATKISDDQIVKMIDEERRIS